LPLTSVMVVILLCQDQVSSLQSDLDQGVAALRINVDYVVSVQVDLR
jgi:hypothetical protein